MSFFDSLILDIILILFPIVCILIIKANVKGVHNLDKDTLIDIANFSSLFLLIKYCDNSNPYMIILVNMPFIISILYNRKYASLIISLILICFNVVVGYNYIFVIGEYFIYILVFVLLYKKGFSNYILISFVSIKGVFLTIYQYYIIKNGIGSLYLVFVFLVVFYLIGTLVINVINMIEKTVTLNYSLRELEKEKNLKNSLFKITHEVKNPIAVCKGYLSMMDYDDIDKVKRYNEIVLSELNRTLDIMDNFSQYTKIKVNMDIMDLDYLIVDTISSLRMLFKSKNITVNYNNDDEIYINGDYDRLKQVLINVLKNSVEAISDEGVIDIKVKFLKKKLVLSIKDNGCGIASDDLKKIDELFYSSKDKGCGIGVSLSKEIIRLHNGDIRYKSVVGKYTEVIIILPLM